MSVCKYLQGIELQGGQFAYQPHSNSDFSPSFKHIFEILSPS